MATISRPFSVLQRCTQGTYKPSFRTVARVVLSRRYIEAVFGHDNLKFFAYCNYRQIAIFQIIITRTRNNNIFVAVFSIFLCSKRSFRITSFLTLDPLWPGGPRLISTFLFLFLVEKNGSYHELFSELKTFFLAKVIAFWNLENIYNYIVRTHFSGVFPTIVCKFTVLIFSCHVLGNKTKLPIFQNFDFGLRGEIIEF